MAAITFKLIFPKYLAVYQNVSFILKVVIPSVANVPKILTRNTMACVTIVWTFWKTAEH